MGKLTKFTATIFSSVCIGHTFFEYVAEFCLLTGPSMEPTFNNSQKSTVVVTEKLSPNKKGYSVGDIVISKSPTNPTSFICKRINAVAGERVPRPDRMYSESPEKYFEIPRGHVWLLGDNLDNSIDSRSFGPVPLGLIRGKVCFKILPLSEFGRM